MNTRLTASLLLVPALAFSTAAMALGQGKPHQHRYARQARVQHQGGGDHHYGFHQRASDRNNGQDQHLPRYRQPPVQRRDPPPTLRGGGDPHRGGGGDPHLTGGGSGQDHGGGDRNGGGDHWRDRGGHDGGDYRHGRGGYGDGDHHRYYWHGDRDDWHGQVYWRANIRLFPRYDWDTWRHGYWYHGWYGRRWGWWWLAGGMWFYYPAPIYPYPNPYVPGTVTVVNTTPSPPPAPPAQAPAVQYWYHCKAPDGYYPYVSQCPGGWTKVPATPPDAKH